jgi:hypothetical protein
MEFIGFPNFSVPTWGFWLLNHLAVVVTRFSLYESPEATEKKEIHHHYTCPKINAKGNSS